MVPNKIVLRLFLFTKYKMLKVKTKVKIKVKLKVVLKVKLEVKLKVSESKKYS